MMTDSGSRSSVKAWPVTQPTRHTTGIAKIAICASLSTAVGTVQTLDHMAQLPAAYAKDVNSRKYPGTYVFTQSIAGLNMIHETVNTRDVLAYTDANGSSSSQREAHEVLSPRYGLALGNTTASLVNINPANGVIELAGVLGGHAFGRYRSSQIPDGSPEVETASHKEPSSNPLPDTSH